MQKHRRYMGIKGFKKKTEILLKSMNEVRVNICQKLEKERIWDLLYEALIETLGIFQITNRHFDYFFT